MNHKPFRTSVADTKYPLNKPIMCMHEHTYNRCAPLDVYKVYLGVELGDSFGALLFCQNKNRLDMKSTECNPGGAEKARDRPDPEGCFNVGLRSEGVERGGNDARLNKLQSKGNVFKCSTWNYRGSNTERRSESEIHWE